MKNTLLLFLSLLFLSCSSIRVYNDFDAGVDFDSYTSYAFFKPGIDEVEISDLDKKRIIVVNSLYRNYNWKKIVHSVIKG